MDNKDLNLLPEEFPSPEELFNIDIGDAVKIEKPKEDQLKPQEQLKEEKTEDTEVKPEESAEEVSSKAKSVPRYRVIKFFSAGFIILILVMALFITNMDRFHLHCYCMMTESMGNTIPKGSVVFSYDVPMEELEIGDVITYINSRGISVTHQIVSEINDYKESGNRAFYTKGTENDMVDEEVVTYEMIKGKVFIYIPYIAKPFIH
ncbi:MAG: signal peptidase I [Dorea sp.]|jgi:signal peptidase I|nr:signal peptidase I [Dorea sp.]